MTPPDKPTKRHRPLRFALGLGGVCALIVTAPLIVPRLLAGSKWDEPDAKPLWKVDERASGVSDLSWSQDGKRAQYFVANYTDRSLEMGTLTSVERSWAERTGSVGTASSGWGN